MASVDVPIVRPTTEAAPKDYEIPAAQEIAPLAVRALVDGSGAAGAFVPALQLISPGGQVMWTAPTSETVAAGASADVSWFPRVGRGGGGGADPNAVHYGVSNESGAFIDATTTTSFTSFHDASGQGIFLTADPGPPASHLDGFIGLETSGTDGVIAVISSSIRNRVKASGIFEVQDSNGTYVLRIRDSRAFIVQQASIDLNGLLSLDAVNIIASLPIMDPGISGALWNNGGFVAVSP